MTIQSISNLPDESAEDDMLMQSQSYSQQRRSSLTSLNGSKNRGFHPHPPPAQQTHKWFKPFSMAPSMSGGGRFASRNMSMKLARTGGTGGGGGSHPTGRYGKGFVPENV